MSNRYKFLFVSKVYEIVVEKNAADGGIVSICFKVNNPIIVSDYIIDKGCTTV